MMDIGSTDALGATWSENLKFFRALGGSVENIKPRQEGRGLLAIDSRMPVAIHVPGNLLFDVKQVEFNGNKLGLRSTADVMDAQRLFFERYHENLSWGRFGRENAARFVAAVDSLPDEVRDVLRADFECEDLLEGDPIERGQRQFLAGSSIRVGDDSYLAPFLDLANHDASGLGFSFGNGELVIRGEVRDEILFAFGVHDSFSAFRTFGIAKEEPGAFSLPVSVTPRSPEILIGRDMDKIAKRGAAWVPLLESNQGRIWMSCLMIGHVRFPKLSRGVFRMLLREAGYADPDDAFDRVLNFNWTRYLRLLEVLEPYQGEMVTSLRKMARHQLESMSHCIGSREPDLSSAAREPEVEDRPVESIWQISIQ